MANDQSFYMSQRQNMNTIRGGGLSAETVAALAATANSPSASIPVENPASAAAKAQDLEKNTKDMRARARQELLDTEISYRDNLHIISHMYMARLKALIALDRPILSTDEISTIFLNIEDIYQLSCQLCKKLEALHLTGWTSIGQVMLKFVPSIKIYTTFVNGYEKAALELAKLSRPGEGERVRKDWADFIELNHYCEKISLQSLMIMPIQRVPRYLLLLDNLLEFTDEKGMCGRYSLECCLFVLYW